PRPPRAGQPQCRTPTSPWRTRYGQTSSCSPSLPSSRLSSRARSRAGFRIWTRGGPDLRPHRVLERQRPGQGDVVLRNRIEHLLHVVRTPVIAAHGPSHIERAIADCPHLLHVTDE